MGEWYPTLVSKCGVSSQWEIFVMKMHAKITYQVHHYKVICVWGLARFVGLLRRVETRRIRLITVWLGSLEVNKEKQNFEIFGIMHMQWFSQKMCLLLVFSFIFNTFHRGWDQESGVPSIHTCKWLVCILVDIFSNFHAWCLTWHKSLMLREHLQVKPLCEAISWIVEHDGYIMVFTGFSW